MLGKHELPSVHIRALTFSQQCLHSVLEHWGSTLKCHSPIQGYQRKKGLGSCEPGPCLRYPHLIYSDLILFNQMGSELIELSHSLGFG